MGKRRGYTLGKGMSYEKMLNHEIDLQREALAVRVNRLGFEHPDVITMSQQLDKLILESQMLKMGKP